jgi:crotonobetainyl-CoA:carnitine CoA-transferase CaiB-like acyl-CoA transferase
VAGALGHIRICDFTGQLAGAGATRYLAAFGAQVIRVEDPVREGRWDILRGAPPYVDDRRGIDLGGAFNNTNPEKLGITLNLRDERGRELLRRLVAVSDVVAENFAAGVLGRLGFDYEALRAIRADIIYVSNSGFGATGPYRSFKSWGPIVQAVSGLTFESGLAGQPPAGWGYSYMDHHGGNFMALAILAALVHRGRTGEGQWVDMSCSEAAATLTGTAILDYTVNGRPSRRTGRPDSNHSDSPVMVPHGIYPCEGEDNWVAIACRDDDDWRALTEVLRVDGHAVRDLPHVRERAVAQDELDECLRGWTSSRERYAVQHRLQAAGVPAAAVQRPGDRIDADEGTAAFGLWPVVQQGAIGEVRVDGFPLHMSDTDWSITRGAPCLGEHNDYVYGELLGVSADERRQLREAAVI